MKRDEKSTRNERMAASSQVGNEWGSEGEAGPLKSRTRKREVESVRERECVRERKRREGELSSGHNN